MNVQWMFSESLHEIIWLCCCSRLLSDVQKLAGSWEGWLSHSLYGISASLATAKLNLVQHFTQALKRQATFLQLAQVIVVYLIARLFNCCIYCLRLLDRCIYFIFQLILLLYLFVWVSDWYFVQLFDCLIYFPTVWPCLGLFSWCIYL